jgi:O-acetyl-ADP-ribose deacetylase (regulator of RNase III)
MNYIDGDLITLAKQGQFDVIAHGCNCFCNMKKGIAPKMAKAFGCDKFPLEDKQYKGDAAKLGKIDYKTISLGIYADKQLSVVNVYSQYDYRGIKPFDAAAFTSAMKEINKAFAGKHIGLPLIGAGLAGGDWDEISKIIDKELKDCTVTIVRFQP